MRNVIKIAAIVAVIGAVAVVALAGGALASTGNTGYSHGMMSNHGSGGMMNGNSHMDGAQTSCNGQGCQGHCSMHANGVTSVNATGSANYGQTGNAASAPTTQKHCWGCC